MSPAVIIAAGVVVVASAGFVIIGSVYKWDLTSEGYNFWTRAVGVVAVIAITGVTAWSRIDQPVIAAVIFAIGIALSMAYVMLHRYMADRVRALLKPEDQ